jgi:hypothetical protein
MVSLRIARGTWRQSAALGPLSVRDFRLFWAGNFVSQCGDQFQLVALAVLALDLTNSPTTLGTVLAAQAIPRTLFMLAGGVVTDRFRASGVLRVTNLLMTALAGSLAALTAVHLLALWHLYVYAVLAGIVYSCAIPSQQSIAAELVPRDQVRHAVALGSTSFNATLFLVPPLAGLVVARLGSAPAFAFNAVSFGVAALGLGFVRGGETRGEARKQDPIRQLREGLAFVGRSPFYRVQLLLAIVYSLGYQGANLVGVPTLAKLTFGAGDAGVGALYGAGGAGALLGAVGVGMIARVRRPGLVSGLTLLAAGLGVALVAATASLSGAASVLFVAIGCHTIAAILGISLAQTQAPAEMRGRVMGLIMFGAVGLEPLSLSVGGMLGAAVGARGIFLVCGIAIALAGVMATASRGYRDAT